MFNSRNEAPSASPRQTAMSSHQPAVPLRGGTGQRTPRYRTGKISNGGFPKAPHVLYKLTDPANGVGIDSVWRADPSNNNKKKFAVVEAKASKHEDAPKFATMHPAERNPSVVSTLGVSGVTRTEDILEPTDVTAKPNASVDGERSARRRNNRARTASSSNPNNTQKTGGSAGGSKGVLVQMSREWISDNLATAFHEPLRSKILKSYSRHLFYAPIYHASGSPKAHAEAILGGLPDADHSEHVAFHYDEEGVREAVNKKKARLAKKYKGHKNLKIEAKA